MSDHSDDGLRDRVRQLEQLVEQQAERIAELESGRDTAGWSRRSVLASAATAAGIGALAGRVRAAPSYGSASGHLGTSGEPVSDVIAQSLRVSSAQLDGVLNGGESGDGLVITSKSISDDDVATVDVSSRSLVFIASRTDSVGAGVFGTGFNRINDFGSSDISIDTGALSGATGPDGTLNLSVDGNTLFLENRTGTQEQYGVYVLG